MDIDNLVTIGEFTCSALGLVMSLFLVKENKKLIVVAVIIGAVVTATGVSLCRWWQHCHVIKQVQDEIIEALASDSLTFDELHQNLLYKSFPVINEALFVLIQDKKVAHRLIRIGNSDRILSVRVYYNRNSTLAVEKFENRLTKAGE